MPIEAEDDDMGGKYRNFQPITAALTHEQYAQLKRLSKRTGLPMQTFLREGVDLVLARYKRHG